MRPSDRPGSGRLALLGAIAALAAILLVDRWLGSGTHALLPTGIADETAHVLTMALILGAWPGAIGARFVAGALIGAVVIDLDHLPLILGSDLLTRETNRPLTHGLLIVVLVAGLALLLPPRWRPFALGVAVGLMAHYFRDMATSTAGVPLLWPLAMTGFTIPYSWYVGLLICLAGLTMWKMRRGRRERYP